MSLLDNEAIAARLKAFREDTAKLSGRKFALNAGIDPAHYQKIEVAKLPVTDNILQKLLALYPQLDKEYVLFGIKAKEGRAIKLDSSDKEINRAIDSVGVAGSLLKVLPDIRPGQSQEETIKTLKEKVEKLEMAIKLLMPACKVLIDKVETVRETS